MICEEIEGWINNENSKFKTSKLLKARENVDNQDAIVIFVSDWLRRGVSFLDQSQRRKAKPMKSSITFDIPLKISLFFLLLPNKPDQKMTANDRNSLAKSALHSGRAGSCQETGREGNWTSVHQERRV